MKWSQLSWLTKIPESVKILQRVHHLLWTRQNLATFRICWKKIVVTVGRMADPSKLSIQNCDCWAQGEDTFESVFSINRTTNQQKNLTHWLPERPKLYQNFSCGKTPPLKGWRTSNLNQFPRESESISDDILKAVIEMRNVDLLFARENGFRSATMLSLSSHFN